MRDISNNFNQLGNLSLIKIGGSLIKDHESCKILADFLSELHKKEKVVLFPGGGDIDNYIEHYNEYIELSRRTFHESTMLALDQTALLFSNYSDSIEPVKNIYELKEIVSANKIPVIMPSTIFFALEPFRYTNRVSSDSYSLYFSYLLDIKDILILKSIDGVCDEKGNTISEITCEELKNMKQNCVDETFPIIADYLKVRISIVNGKKLTGIKDFFDRKERIRYGTSIQYN